VNLPAAKVRNNLRPDRAGGSCFTQRDTRGSTRARFTSGRTLAFSNDASDGGTLRDPFRRQRPAGKVGDNEVVAGIFLLIRTQDIMPEVFVCPQSDGE